MVRRARRKSLSGIYHVMVRGIDRQLIFRCPSDFMKYRSVVKECKLLCGFELYAYCLMPNHVHFLIREGKEDIGKVMQRIGSRYAYWFNKKYERCGYLFQDRFKSETVDDHRYFSTLLRYIHRNPVVAGLSENAGDYRWSSYNEFVGKKGLIDLDYPLHLFADDKKTARTAFIEHVCQEEAPLIPNDVTPKMRHGLSVPKALSPEISSRISGTESALKILAKQSIDERNQYIRKLKSEGIPMHQIAKHLKVSIWTVRKA